jgi:HEPN domain-containing protein
MSAEKLRQEARRWLSQAKSDVAAASDSAKARRHEWACFQSQQAAEKAMKACWFHLDLDPWGHSVAKLVDDLPKAVVKRFAAAAEPARHLDKLYIATRYPNGLPELTPAEAYTAKEAADAIASAETVLTLAERFMSDPAADAPPSRRPQP